MKGLLTGLLAITCLAGCGAFKKVSVPAPSAKTPAADPGASVSPVSDVEESATLLASDGAKLGGKWALPPNGRAPKAALVLLPGSGNVGTDGDVSGPLLGKGHGGAPANLSDELARALAADGFASFRYAKRGFEDPSQLANQTFPFLIQDAASAVDLARKRFPAAKVGLVGISEGALLSVLVAARQPLDALFLLSLPTRTVDESLAYQFLEWPTELIASKLDPQGVGQIPASELAMNGNVKFPLIGPGFSEASWQTLDANHDGALSVNDELIPAYEKIYAVAMGMVQNPPFAAWYESYRQLPEFSSVARGISAPTYLYQGELDAQIRWSWAVEDQRYFSGKTSLRLFRGLGHCFAPMEGMLGEVKTSGPIDSNVVTALVQDLNSAFPTSR